MKTAAQLRSELWPFKPHLALACPSGHVAQEGMGRELREGVHMTGGEGGKRKGITLWGFNGGEGEAF